MVRRCSVNYCMGDLQSTIILGPGTRSSTLGRLWFCMDRARRNYAHGPLPIIMQCPSRCCWRAGRTGGLAGWLGGTVVGWLALSWLAATTGGRVELTLRRLILYQSRIVRVSLWGVHGSTQQQPRPEPEIRRLAGSSLSCLRAGETVGQHGRDDAQRSRSRSRSRLGGTLSLLVPSAHQTVGRVIHHELLHTGLRRLSPSPSPSPSKRRSTRMMITMIIIVLWPGTDVPSATRIKLPPRSTMYPFVHVESQAATSSAPARFRAAARLLARPPPSPPAPNLALAGRCHAAVLSPPSWLAGSRPHRELHALYPRVLSETRPSLDTKRVRTFATGA